MFWPGAYDPLILLLAGIAIDAIFGEMRLVFMVVPHPVDWFHDCCPGH